MYMRVQICLLNPNFNAFGYITGSSIAGSYCISVFNFLKNLYTVFHSNCTIFHSHQQCTKVSISIHACQHLSVICFHNSPPKSCEAFPCTFICISLVIIYGEHLFMYLLVVCMSPLEKCLFSSFAHF